MHQSIFPVEFSLNNKNGKLRIYVKSFIILEHGKLGKQVPFVVELEMNSWVLLNICDHHSINLISTAR